jgi:hypothetical protein
VIDYLDRLAGVNAKGAVTLGWDRSFDTYIDILTGCIAFVKEVPESKRVQITRNAVIEAKKAGGLTAAAVLTTVDAAQREFLRLPSQRFVLLTAASIRYGDHLRPVRFAGASVSFMRRRPARFPIPSGGSLRVRDDTPPDYSYIKSYVSARDPRHAATLAFDNADTLRAIWNLILNARIASRVSGGTEGFKPVNAILPGPIHTLHFPNGSLALEGQWWYTLLPRRILAKNLAPQFGAIKSQEAFIRKQVRRCSFGAKLLDLILRYGRALDEPDLYNALLRLWAVLEDLTGTPKGSYDVLVRRASFLWRDHKHARLVLDYLREHRNQIVHAGSQPTEVERLIYELKTMVEVTLWFLIHRASEFERAEDFWSLLDLPPEIGVLRRRARQHQVAMTLHGRVAGKKNARTNASQKSR